MHFFKGKLGQVYRNNLTTYRQMFYSDHIRMSLLKKKQPKKNNDETHSISSSIEYFILIFKKIELKFSVKMNLYE